MPGYGWTNSTLQQMIANVDKLLLCTYDYKVREDNLQPLAPFEWFKDNADFVYRLAQNKSEKRKLMMGFPLYGNMLTMKGLQTIDGQEMLDLMESEKLSFHWKPTIQECHTVTANHSQVTFPCLRFFVKRLEMLEEDYPEVGAFVWEIGQGLDYQLDVF